MITYIPILLFTISIISIAISIAISIPLRTAQGWPIILGIICSSIAPFAYGVEILAVDLNTKIFWVIIRYAALTLFTIFMAQSTLHFMRVRTRQRVLILLVFSMIPVASVVLLALYPNSHLIYDTVWLDRTGAVPMLRKTNGPLYWVNQAYLVFQLLLLAGAVLWYSRKGSTLNRRQSYVISTGLIFPAVAEIFYLNGARIYGIFNPFFLAYLPSALFIWYGIQRLHLTTIRPIASTSLIEQMQDGILVIDEQGILIDINPSALMYLHGKASSLLGRPIQKIDPSLAGLLSGDAAKTKLDSTLTIHNVPLQVNVTPVMMRKQEYAGNLIILHDIHDRLEADRLKEAEIIRQSAWIERQKIARTLHDSITQSLNSLVLLSNSAGLRLEQSRYDQLLPVISLISSSARTAVQEMRELIHEMQLEAPGEFNLINALTERVNLVSAQSEIQISMETPPCIPLESYQQREFFYIILEALNNILQHARASKVSIRLKHNGIAFTVDITDDGRGFDLTSVRSEGMGLSNIRERARQLGAQVQIESSPGSGTTMILVLATV